MKSSLFIGILVLILLGGVVNSLDQSVSVIYSFIENTSLEANLDFSDVLLKINTIDDTICKYSSQQNIPYSYMEGNFEETTGILHKKTFVGFGDGVYEYYVKCLNDSSDANFEPAQLKVTLRINSLVSAQVVLDEDDPLNEGTFEITLITSKVVSSTPILSYSFDGVVYSELPLFGAEKIWKGYLIISEEIGEGVVSFKFKANDLEGRQGTVISSGAVFVIDTINPERVNDFVAEGNIEEVELNWHFDEDFNKFNIYRSESSGVDYTDFYKSVKENSFTDVSVNGGKNYYYRVSVVDDAGNEGELSKEIYVTVLKTGQSVDSSGLALNLVGYVENFLTEVNLFIIEADNINSLFDLKSEKERALFEDLNLKKELESAKSELNSLKREVENYKLQDLSYDELTKKLDSSKVKLNIIKKKMPESLIVVEDGTQSQEILEEDIQEAILELEPLFSENQISNSLDETLKIMKDSELEIQSEFYILEIVYLDGTRKEISVVKRNIFGEMERINNGYFVEIIPKDVIENAFDIEVENSDFEVVKEDPVLSFGTDLKKLVYSLEKKSISSLKQSKFVFVKISEAEDSSFGSKITGYFSYGDESLQYGGVIIIVLVLVFTIYFFYFLKNKTLKSHQEILNKIQEAEVMIQKKDFKSAKEIYNLLKIEYSKLSNKEKKLLYFKLERLHKEIKGLEGKKSGI